MLLSDSVKWHYQSCEVIQDAVYCNISGIISIAGTQDNDNIEQPQADIPDSPPNESLDTMPSPPQQPPCGFNEYMALLQNTDDESHHAKTTVMVVAASITTMAKQEQRITYLEDQMQCMFAAIKQVSENMGGINERVIVLEAETVWMIGPAISIGDFEAASEDDCKYSWSFHLVLH